MKIFTLILQQSHLLIREVVIMVPIASLRDTNYTVYSLHNPRTQCCKCNSDFFFYYCVSWMERMKGRFPCIQKYYGLPNKVSNSVVLHKCDLQSRNPMFDVCICKCDLHLCFSLTWMEWIKGTLGRSTCIQNILLLRILGL